MPSEAIALPTPRQAAVLRRLRSGNIIVGTARDWQPGLRQCLQKKWVTRRGLSFQLTSAGALVATTTGANRD